MKKYALIFKYPTCGKVVRAIAFNMLAKRDIAAECTADIRDSLERHDVPLTYYGMELDDIEFEFHYPNTETPIVEMILKK